MLCIGYGQFPPQTKAEMYTTMSLMLVGAITFAVFIGIATSIVQSHNASKRLYAEKYASVKHYMIFRKIPTELRRRISDYYENRFQDGVRKMGYFFVDFTFSRFRGACHVTLYRFTRFTKCAATFLYQHPR